MGYLDNYSDVTLPTDYTTIQLPLGEFSKTFELGEGIKKVCIYLPWSVSVEIRELSLDDNSFIKPVRPTKKMLMLGDSITHGYDALRPSKRYAAQIAEAFDAEEINKGIGGEMFFPPLAKARENFEPDYITVAYGSNDWRKTDGMDFRDKCYDFYAALSIHYPNAQIFAIAPIWRKDYTDERPFGAFSKVAECVEEVVKDFKNITFINGFDFVPQHEDYFGDLRLHPNDEGFDCYFKNLYKEMEKTIHNEGVETYSAEAVKETN